MFARLGVPVYDADAAVHRLYEPGGAAVAADREAFPTASSTAAVDRARLARQLAATTRPLFKTLEADRPSARWRANSLRFLEKRARSRRRTSWCSTFRSSSKRADMPGWMRSSSFPRRPKSSAAASSPPRHDAKKSSIKYSPARCPMRKSVQKPISWLRPTRACAHAFEQVKNIVAELKRRWAGAK